MCWGRVWSLYCDGLPVRQRARQSDSLLCQCLPGSLVFSWWYGSNYCWGDRQHLYSCTSLSRANSKGPWLTVRFLYTWVCHVNVHPAPEQSIAYWRGDRRSFWRFVSIIHYIIAGTRRNQAHMLDFFCRKFVSLYWLSINLRGIQDICQGIFSLSAYDIYYKHDKGLYKSRSWFINQLLDRWCRRWWGPYNHHNNIYSRATLLHPESQSTKKNKFG